MYVIRSREISLSDKLITSGDRAALADWIADGGSLARGEHTAAFEREFATWLGVRHAIMVNSGASGNLVMAYALKQGGQLRNMRVVAPALCRPTTIAPLLHAGFQVSLCDCAADSWNIDITQLEQVLEEKTPALMVLPHILGMPSDMEAIRDLCALHDVILLEDAREALGSAAMGRKTGTFGTAASFSLRDGYQLSTVEGGMIVTDDDDLHQSMLSLRAHGTSTYRGPERRNQLRQRLGHVDFGTQTGFLHAGFGLNGAEVNAFLGRRQLKRLDGVLERCARNRSVMARALGEQFLQQSGGDMTASNMFGTLVRNRTEVFEFLRYNRIESRPMIATNVARLPFWYAQNGTVEMPVADKVHDMGLALPVHSGLGEVEIVRIAELVLKIADPA